MWANDSRIDFKVMKCILCQGSILGILDTALCKIWVFLITKFEEFLHFPCFPKLFGKPLLIMAK